MAVKVREKEDVYLPVAHPETRRGGDDDIVERPRWFEDLARPPYKPRADRVAEVERR
jgi:hypothetical protein